MIPKQTSRRPVFHLIAFVLCLLLGAGILLHNLYQAHLRRSYSPPGGDEGDTQASPASVLDSKFSPPIDLRRLRPVDIQVLYDDAVVRMTEWSIRWSSAQNKEANVLIRHLPAGHFELYGAEILPKGDSTEPSLPELVRFEQIGLAPPNNARALYPDIITITDEPVSLSEVPDPMGFWLLSMLVDPPQRRVQVELGWLWTISSTWYFQYRVEDDGRLRYLGYASSGCARSPMDFVPISEPAR